MQQRNEVIVFPPWPEMGLDRGHPTQEALLHEESPIHQEVIVPVEFISTRQTIEELHRYAESSSGEDFERLLVVATCAIESYLLRRNSGALFSPNIARNLMACETASLHDWLDVVDETANMPPHLCLATALPGSNSQEAT